MPKVIWVKVSFMLQYVSASSCLWPYSCSHTVDRVLNVPLVMHVLTCNSYRCVSWLCCLITALQIFFCLPDFYLMKETIHDIRTVCMDAHTININEHIWEIYMKYLMDFSHKDNSWRVWVYVTYIQLTRRWGIQLHVIWIPQKTLNVLYGHVVASVMARGNQLWVTRDHTIFNRQLIPCKNDTACHE